MSVQHLASPPNFRPRVTFFVVFKFNKREEEIVKIVQQEYTIPFLNAFLNNVTNIYWFCISGTENMYIFSLSVWPIQLVINGETFSHSFYECAILKKIIPVKQVYTVYRIAHELKLIKLNTQLPRIQTTVQSVFFPFNHKTLFSMYTKFENFSDLRKKFTQFLCSVTKNYLPQFK